LILETYGLTKGYWSLEEIGNACLKKGVSFEMLNPPFQIQNQYRLRTQKMHE
jgi:hypothetical protein